MKPESIAFLRGIGLDEEAIRCLRLDHQPMTITGDSLASWLRAAYRAGRDSTHDVYAWYSVEELMKRPLL